MSAHSITVNYNSMMDFLKHRWEEQWNKRRSNAELLPATNYVKGMNTLTAEKKMSDQAIWDEFRITKVTSDIIMHLEVLNFLQN